MNSEIRRILGKLGLNEKEVRAYLTLLKGPLFASELAGQCALSRPNAYDVLKKLQAKGLAHQLSAAHGKKFKASSAAEVKELIAEKQTELELLGQEINKILPNLYALEGTSVEPFPKLEFFQGQEGIRKMINRTLTAKNKVVRGALSVKNWVDLLGKEFTIDYVRRRVEKGIKSQTLRCKKGELDEAIYNQHADQNRVVRYAPKSINLDATVILFDDYIGFMTTQKESIGILIQSRDLSSTFSSWFDFIWREAK